MRRSALLDVLSLHQSLEHYGRHDTLVDYLAAPRIPLGANQAEFVSKSKQALIDRVPFSNFQGSGYAPNDSTVFKKRFNLLGTNNRAYAIAVKDHPTASELEEFSVQDPWWATLFPVKLYLFHHPAEAKIYRGFLPFGSEVIRFIRELNTDFGSVFLEDHSTAQKGSPDFKDYVMLMNITNALADLYGYTTVAINNEMFLEGQRLTAEDKKKNQNQKVA